MSHTTAPMLLLVTFLMSAASAPLESTVPTVLAREQDVSSDFSSDSTVGGSKPLTKRFQIKQQCGKATSLKKCKADGYSCTTLSVNGLCFDCRTSGPANAPPAMLLHGFPFNADYWTPLTDYWNKHGTKVSALACSLRGASPGASPTNYAAYEYDTLMSDIWGLVDAAWGSAASLHLIGHDHGAVAAWVIGASAKGVARLQSLTTMAIPHPDVFGSALYGSGAVKEQQFSMNYLNNFRQPDAYKKLKILFKPQVMWYWGAVPRKLAAPPVLEVTPMSHLEEPKSALMIDVVRGIYGGLPKSQSDGLAQVEPTGNVTVKTLFVCGKNDAYSKCSMPYVHERTPPLVPHLTTVEVDCGHKIITWGDCSLKLFSSTSEVDRAMSAMTSFIEQ